MTKFQKNNHTRNQNIRVKLKSNFVPKLSWHPVQFSDLNTTVSDTASGIIVLVLHTAAFHNVLCACAEGKQLFDDGAFRDLSKIQTLLWSLQNTVEIPSRLSYSLFFFVIFLNLSRIAFKLLHAVRVVLGTAINNYLDEEIVQKAHKYLLSYYLYNKGSSLRVFLWLSERKHAF